MVEQDELGPLGVELLEEPLKSLCGDRYLTSGIIIIIIITFALIESCLCIYVNHSPSPLVAPRPASGDMCVYVCVSKLSHLGYYVFC